MQFVSFSLIHSEGFKIGLMVFVVSPPPPPLPPFPPNRQSTSNSKLIGNYLMYGFMRLSYLTVSRYTVAQAIINIEPLTKTHS